MVSRLEFYQCHAENVLTFTKAGAGEIENMNKKNLNKKDKIKKVQQNTPSPRLQENLFHQKEFS